MRIISLAVTRVYYARVTVMMTGAHLVCAEQSQEGVRRYLLRALGEGVRDLEQRRNTEGLGEVGAQARKAQVVEEDIALHFLCNVLYSSRVAQTERFPPRLERRVCVSDGGYQGVVGQSRERA